MTRIGVISAYPDEDWDARRIWEAARGRGEALLLRPTDFACAVGDGETVVTACGRDARDYDLFLTPRAVGDEGDVELQLEIYRTLSESGAVVVNAVGALTTAIDKFKTSWLLERAGLPTPRVRVAQRIEDARRALGELGDAVAKPVFGSLGIGVERLRPGDEARLFALLEAQGAVYLQAFVPAVERDVRAFVVGDRVEAAIVRRPKPGEFRANLSLGATAEPTVLAEPVARLAVAAAHALGLDYAGVDLLLGAGGPQLVEVNGTPSFRGVNEATGRDMAEAIVEHAIARSRVHGRDLMQAGRSR